MKDLINCDLIGARIVNPATKTNKCIDLYIRNGKIDFSRSNVKLDSCKTYFFNLSKKNILNFEVINCSKIIELKNITPN